MLPKILAVDDDETFLKSLSNLLRYKNYEVEAVSNPLQVESVFLKNDFDCVLLDVMMPGLDGISLLKRLQEHRPAVPVIMISGQSTITKAVEAIKLGAFDFVEKPLDAERLLISIKNALDKRGWHEEKKHLILQLGESYRFVGHSAAMRKVFSQIQRVAPTNAKVLILGETGTGKELVARAIYYQSNRLAKPFVKVNCAAIPSELLESELFGYRKGAFTGASQDHRGKFLVADGGTLFLDEIADMSLQLQGKLLRVLQEGEVEVVGETRPRQVDVRVIAATNKNLVELVEAEKFRQDLFHRLNVITIHLPPLRERGEDIPHLARFFLNEFAQEYNRQFTDFTPQALSILIQQDWPGNVRELRNIIEKTVIFSKGPIVQAIDIQQALEMRQSAQAEAVSFSSLKDARDAFEKKLILQNLEAFNWKIGETAKALGIDRTALYKKMRKYGIHSEEEMQS